MRSMVSKHDEIFQQLEERQCRLAWHVVLRRNGAFQHWKAWDIGGDGGGGVSMLGNTRTAGISLIYVMFCFILFLFVSWVRAASDRSARWSSS